MKPMKISTSRVDAHIKRFESAVRWHEMKGAQHPEIHSSIEKEYHAAKANLKRFMIESITLHAS